MMDLSPITLIQQDWFDPETPSRSRSPTRYERSGAGLDQSPPSPSRRSRASVLRREHVLARHNDSVLAMVVSRRTNHLFSGDQDGLVIVWELSTFSFECELVGHRRPVTSMVLSSAPITSRHVLVTSSRDNTIRIWDAARMTPLVVLDHMSCCALDLVLHQGMLIAACIDTRIAVLDLGAILARDDDDAARIEFADVAACHSGHLGFVYALVVTRSQLFSASGDFNIGVWSLSPIAHERSLQGHTDSVTALDVIADTYLISGSRDGSIKVWGLPACHLVRSVDVGAAVVCVCVTAWALFVSTVDNVVHALDLQTFRPIPKGRTESNYTTLYMCADRQFLFTCGTDNTVIIWRSEIGAADLRRPRRPGSKKQPVAVVPPFRDAPVPESSAFRNLLVAAGAEKYADTFAEHEIDYEALLLLNDGDLEEIGVPLGTRRKIVALADRIVGHAQLNSNDDDLIHFLRRLVALATVSSDPMRRADAWNCARLIEQTLMGLGAETRLRQVNTDANPILIAQIASVLPNTDHRKLVFYAHYDVVAVVAEHWSSPPFELSGRNGYLYGRGASDNKGPLAAFIAALKELIGDDGGLPIDVALILDGEAETDPFAGGLPTAVLAAMDWLSQPSVILLANTTWSGQDCPCLNYGTRGILEMEITVSGPSKDLHSGVHGGAFHEPMIDLAQVLATLVDADGRVRIDGFYDNVAPLEPDEAVLYDNLDFDLDGYRHEIGIDRLRREDVAGHLQGVWRQPCLSIYEIKGAGRCRCLHSIVSGSVGAAISMRLVPNQDIDRIAELCEQHVDREFARLRSCNSVAVCVRHKGNWWLGDPRSEAYQVAAEAIEQVWQQKPSMIREGGTMPTIRFLEDTLLAPAVHLAFGQASDQSHLENERIRIKNLLRGRDVFKAFVRAVAAGIPEPPSEPPASIAKMRTDPRCLSVVGPNHIIIRQATVEPENVPPAAVSECCP